MTAASHLAAMAADISALRFCPMYVPADEVAGITRLESHTTRARAVQMWRIAAGHARWTARDAAILYETTLDSLSEAFDVWHAPIRRMMLAARADIWASGLAPPCVVRAVGVLEAEAVPVIAPCETVFIGGEAAQCAEAGAYLEGMAELLDGATCLATQTGAAACALGAVDAARRQAEGLRDAIVRANPRTLIADGPETLWALTKLWPELGAPLPTGIRVVPLMLHLARTREPSTAIAGPVFVHDARAAYLLSETKPEALTVMPGYARQPGAQEKACGTGSVFDVPRAAVAAAGIDMVWGQWTRGLARCCGADDGLHLTHPHLGAGLARERLAYAAGLGARTLASDSPMAADWLLRHRTEGDPAVLWLPRLYQEAGP